MSHHNSHAICRISFGLLTSLALAGCGSMADPRPSDAAGPDPASAKAAITIGNQVTLPFNGRTAFDFGPGFYVYDGEGDVTFSDRALYSRHWDGAARGLIELGTCNAATDYATPFALAYYSRGVYNSAWQIRAGYCYGIRLTQYNSGRTAVARILSVDSAQVIMDYVIVDYDHNVVRLKSDDAWRTSFRFADQSTAATYSGDFHYANGNFYADGSSEGYGLIDFGGCDEYTMDHAFPATYWPNDGFVYWGVPVVDRHCYLLKTADGKRDLFFVENMQPNAIDITYNIYSESLR